jgi:hypothetical protein
MIPRNWPSLCPIRLIVLLLFLEAPGNHFARSGSVMVALATDVDEAVQPVVDPPLQASHPSDPAAPVQRSLLVEADGNPKANSSSMVTHTQRNFSLERSLPLLSPPSGRAAKHELVPVNQPIAKLRRDVTPVPPPQPSLMSLLEGNSSAESLLELSDTMLENASQLIHTIAQVDSLQGHRLFPNATMTGVPRLSNVNAPALRRREEQTIKELADHSGKLQRLFEKLEHDLTTEDYGADSLDVHGPVSHAELVEDSIPDVIEEDKPTAGANLRTHPAQGSSYSLLVQDQKSFRLAIVAILVGIFFAVSLLGLIIHYRTRNEHLLDKLDDSETKEAGSTQYVIRVHKVSVMDLPSRTALAWQISVAGENPRPSRFTNLAVWDAPVDRLDVEVAQQGEKIAVEVLQQSEVLGPPTKVATVEIPATVLLAEASGKKERVLSGGDEVYVHEKKLALYPRGELVIEYSLIAFFHWYVGGDASSSKDI